MEKIYKSAVSPKRLKIARTLLYGLQSYVHGLLIAAKMYDLE